MRTFIAGVAAIALSTVAMAACATAQPAAAPALAADPARPEADVTRDAKRKPAEMVAFAGIKPGMKVVDLNPGGGYFTRIFSKVVGPSGKVYAAAGPGRDGAPPAVNAVATNAAYTNVTVVTLSPQVTYTTPELVDVVWTSRNYHDFRNPTRNVDMLAMNKAIFASLKPGGIYIVLDHAAAAGTGADIPGTLHRISPDLVKQDVLAAGFQFVGDSNALVNPADDLNKRVFEESAPDISSQFILKFRKP